MSFAQMVYKLLLGPLELLFDAVYTVAYNITAHPGLAIIFLSLAINLLVLPLYRRADAMQEEERLQSLRMKPGIDQIKKVFRGDERFMILQTYYRQNNYKPYYALKGSVSLLLEIPFFIAAYRYLSGLSLLQGAAFGPIADLGSPDQLVRFGNVSINLLPVLMTAINIVSGAIYTKGMPLKSKVQLYGMALIFLVLLYNSPSGLVFYWTLNNLFSLVKNVFYKIPNPRKVLKVLCSMTGIAVFLFFCVLHPVVGMRRKALAAGIAVLMQLPLLTGVLKRKSVLKELGEGTKENRVIFFAGCVFLTLLLGLLIPSAVIASSPGEFVEMADFHNPLRYLVSSGLLAAGTFLVWFGIFYRLSSPKGKRLFSLAMAVVSVVAVIDYMFFGKGYGTLSPLLKYELPILNTAKNYLVNTAVLFAAAALVWLLWKKKPELLKAVCIAGCIAVTVMSVMNVRSIQGKAHELEAVAKQPQEEVRFPLSREGKNVVVIMLDRAISWFAPYVLNEKPELLRQFAGFTFYPNTLSYGGKTNVGTPPLYGGYDYIPDEINARSDVLLKDKQNEALKIMPVNFYENGFEVTVCDPTYANYKDTPDLSIYDDYPGMHTYNTIGRYMGIEEEFNQMEYNIWNRNFFCYGIFKAAPLLLQNDLYHEGTYLSSLKLSSYDTPQVIDTPSVSHGIDLRFMKNYAVLNRLPEMTSIGMAEQNNTFLMLSNEITHAPMLTQTPDYVPQNEVDNTEYDEEHAVRYSLNGDEFRLDSVFSMYHYHALMVAFIQLGNWFDYLRENDVWDNTRIILVADHGFYMGQYCNLQLEVPAGYANDDFEIYMDVLNYNPLFMVKNFDSQEFTIDYTFMTNADTPLQAFSGLIESPMNPFLGTPITDAHKYDDEQHVLFRDWHISRDAEYTTFLEVNAKRWLTLRNSNIFDLENWTIEQR